VTDLANDLSMLLPAVFRIISCRFMDLGLVTGVYEDSSSPFVQLDPENSGLVIDRVDISGSATVVSPPDRNSVTYVQVHPVVTVHLLRGLIGWHSELRIVELVG
jgi:hypothetical protein